MSDQMDEKIKYRVWMFDTFNGMRRRVTVFAGDGDEARSLAERDNRPLKSVRAEVLNNPHGLVAPKS